MITRPNGEPNGVTASGDAGWPTRPHHHGRAVSAAVNPPRSADNTTRSLHSGLRSDGLAITITFHQGRIDTHGLWG